MKYLKNINEISIRDEYAKLGIHDFYNLNKNSYVNPHLDNIKLCLDWIIENIKINNFLDLSAGNGEVSLYLNEKGIKNFMGTDPYLYDTYEKNTGKKCLKLSFEDIAVKGLGKNFQTIICSYALHLCPKSYFNDLMYNLSSSCEFFVLISPSKFPIINDDYFELIDSTIINRIHCQIYKSKLF